MKAAITGVSASNEGMKWYEVIPVAAIVGGVSAVTGHRDQSTELYVEAVLLDPATNEPVPKVDPLPKCSLFGSGTHADKQCTA